jgi:hypothetical protein
MFTTLLTQENLSLENNSVFELSNVDFVTLQKEKDNLEELIFLHEAKLRQLDFANETNRAFIFLLLDLCERLQIPDGFQSLMNIAHNNKIEIGSRLFAASLYLSIAEAQQCIDRFDDICKNLTKAIEEDEDNNYKVLETFANYYLYVLSLNPKWIIELKEKINESNIYSFLSDKFVVQVLSFSVEDKNKCKQQIQQQKDELFNRYYLVRKGTDNSEFLIEQGSKYENQLNTLKNISFDKLRDISVNQVNFDSKLDNRGVTPLTMEKELFIYMKSFGNMHYAKMISALNFLPKENIEENIEIIDWGCGQALATIVFLEYCKKNNISIKPNVILIEPSEIALKRASLHAKCFCPEAKIKTVCKYLDEIDKDDILTTVDTIKIHLFSNILDVELFSISQLENLISETQKGLNYFICVSPYINDLKTERIESFNRYFSNKYNSYQLLGTPLTNSGRSDDIYWNCNKNFNGNRCLNHPSECKGKNKWTRVIRVFKVEF